MYSVDDRPGFRKECVGLLLGANPSDALSPQLPCILLSAMIATMASCGAQHTYNSTHKGLISPNVGSALPRLLEGLAFERILAESDRF